MLELSFGTRSYENIPVITVSCKELVLIYGYNAALFHFVFRNRIVANRHALITVISFFVSGKFFDDSCENVPSDMNKSFTRSCPQHITFEK